MSPRHPPHPPSRQVLLARRVFSGAFFATFLSFVVVLLLWWRGLLGGTVALAFIALTILSGLLSLTGGIVLIFRDTGGAPRRHRSSQHLPDSPQ